MTVKVQGHFSRSNFFLNAVFSEIPTGRIFFWTPPKTLEYKIPLYPLALREISDQLTWDLVL